MTYLRTSLSFSFGLGLAAAVSSSAGCGLGACTEIGCADGVFITATIAGASDEAATVRVFADGAAAGAFDCAVVGEACTQSDGGTADVWVDRTAAGEFYVNGSDGETVRVEVDLAGQTYAGEVVPEWEETRPNGPGCPPVCRVAPDQDLPLAAV